MIAFVDVQYGETSATAACLLAEQWDTLVATKEWTRVVSPVAPYEPGAFYKRELPCLLAVLEPAPPLTHIVIDGYVWLDTAKTPGLGARLYEALGGKTVIIGLAKTAYRGSPMATPIARPGSKKPLFFTCIGEGEPTARAHIDRLHGTHRLPTLVKRVDLLARGR